MATTIKIAVTMNIRAGEAFEIALGLAQHNLPDGSEITVSYGVGNSRLGGFEAPRLLAEGTVDLAFLNPSPVTHMALNGLAPYAQKIDIRNLAVFPSWDRIAFAVRKDLGLTSLEEIGEKKLPLRAVDPGTGSRRNHRVHDPENPESLRLEPRGGGAMGRQRGSGPNPQPPPAHGRDQARDL